MKEIKLTQGKFAQVDDEDFEWLNKVKWYAHNESGFYYAVRKKSIDGKKRILSMHRTILNTPKNLLTDHIDHNGLNNQRSNLRVCTASQNAQNRNPSGRSKYLGVTIVKDGQYRAQIAVNGAKFYLGLFKSEIAAAKAYDNAAKEYFGEFANLNFKEIKVT